MPLWLIGVAALSIVLFFLPFGAERPPMFMEYFYLESAREMLNHGDWITPTFNEVNRFDKPILFYWLVMLAFRILGSGVAAARLVSSLMAIGVILVTYALGRSLYSARAARWALLVLVTTPVFILFARTAIPDLALTFFITLALFAFHRGTASSPPQRGGLYLFYTAAALATLTKGPLAVLLLVLVIAGYFLVWKEHPPLRQLAIGSGTAVFLAIFLPWFIFIIMKHGHVYLDYIWNIQQKAALGEKRYPWHFYLRHFFWDFLPWSPLVAGSLTILWRNRLDVTGEGRLPLPWLIMIFAFFSLVSLKAVRYLLPLTPAFALSAGWFLDRATRISGSLESKIVRLVAWIVAGAGLLGGVLFAGGLTAGIGMSGPVSRGAYFWPVLLILTSTALLISAVRRSTPDQAIWMAGLVTAAFLSYFSLASDLAGPSPAGVLSGVINANRPAGTPLGVYRLKINEWVYEVGPPVVLLTDPEDLKRFQAANPSGMIVMSREDFESDGNRRNVIGHAVQPTGLRWKPAGSESFLNGFKREHKDFYLTAGPVPADSGRAL